MEMINAKLDKILNLLAPTASKETPKKIEIAKPKKEEKVKAKVASKKIKAKKKK
jgi:hypothetical protein